MTDLSPDALIAPASSCEAITASSSEFAPTRAIYINAAGSFALTFADDTAEVTLSLAAGVHPFRVKKCTSGTGLYALR